MHPAHICVTCGVEHAPAPQPPAHCAICEDERQYVGLGGQKWTTLAAMRGTHHNVFIQEGVADKQAIWGIVTEPKFAIGQRALLIPTPSGNVLWDCVTLIDPDTIALVKALGGVSAIAVSHPHYYSSMVEWSQTFNAPIYIHENDRQWVQRTDASIHFWSGETHSFSDGANLIRIGGHFPGFQCLHSGSALFTGDLPQVCPDRRWVSFMYSYPNYLPLSAPSVKRIAAVLEPFDYDQLYGAWPGFVIKTGAKEALRRSAERYLRELETSR